MCVEQEYIQVTYINIYIGGVVLHIYVCVYIYTHIQDNVKQHMHLRQRSEAALVKS